MKKKKPFKYKKYGILKGINKHRNLNENSSEEALGKLSATVKINNFHRKPLCVIDTNSDIK